MSAPCTTPRSPRLVTAATALLVGAPIIAASPAAAAPGVCDGVARCRVVAHVDVNGDGTPDGVGIARRGANGAERGAVIVRVRTRPGHIVSVRKKTESWYGDPFQGTARVDGRPGKEIFVGHVLGAHTLFHRALTWRHGALVTLGAPGPGADWVVDGSYAQDYGWRKRATDARGVITRRVAVRVRDTDSFRGTLTTYRWTREGWARTAIEHRRLSERAAARWAGFAVRGLDRF